MKKISEHLGEIIVALAGVALIIAACVAFKTPIGNFFNGIIAKETNVGNEIINGIGVDLSMDAGAGGAVDLAGKNQVTMLNGEYVTYNKTDSDDVIYMRSPAAVNTLESITIDGEVVDPSHYTITEGSTIVVFDTAYSQQLSTGEHAVNIVSEDQYAVGTVNVVEAGATFNDGTTLSWSALKLSENGTKYGYDASAISDTAIGAYAFNGCESLVAIVIPDDVTVIGEGAFCQCYKLTTATLPNNLEELQPGAFSECTGLVAVNIPSGLTFLGDAVFGTCTSLNSIVFKGTVAQWNAYDMVGTNTWAWDIPANQVVCHDGAVTIVK